MKYPRQGSGPTEFPTNFIPREDLYQDSKYARLTRSLSERQVAYSWSRTMRPGPRAATACLREVSPELSASSAAAMATLSEELGGQFEHCEGVRRLLAHLNPRWAEHVKKQEPHAPLTLEDILRTWARFFRETTDPKLKMDLGEALIKYGQLDKKPGALDDVIDFDPEILAEMLGWNKDVDSDDATPDSQPAT